MNAPSVIFRIEVDDRESASPVLPALHECADFQVMVARLPLGDYRIDGRFLFERKTLTDLVAAIKDGRLFRQALKLSATTMQPAIILEGTGREHAGSGMRWEAIQGALVTVSLFGSVEPITRAGAEDLCSVPGIGERIAGALRWSLEAPRCDYRFG